MPNKFNNSKRHHIPKQSYKLTNWSEYNQSLMNRGRIDIWINEEIIDTWNHHDRTYDGTGSSPHYTDEAILICHEIRMILRLPLRQIQGYIDSLFDMLDFLLTCPSYSQLSRRLQDLNIKTPLYQKQHNTQIENNDVVALTIDSTGLKRFGRDEWHQEKHKVSSKRSWRKMHIGSDDSHYIRAAVMTDKNTKDEAVVGDICDQISVPVGQVFADKAYDENTVYDTLERHFPNADIVIPPKQNLLYDEQRDHRVRSQAMLEIAAKGQMAWQKKHEYGKRAHGELAMQRYKRTFGNQLHSRSFNNQKTRGLSDATTPFLYCSKYERCNNALF